MIVPLLLDIFFDVRRTHSSGVWTNSRTNRNKDLTSLFQLFVVYCPNSKTTYVVVDDQDQILFIETSSNN